MGEEEPNLDLSLSIGSTMERNDEGSTSKRLKLNKDQSTFLENAFKKIQTLTAVFLIIM